MIYFSFYHDVSFNWSLFWTGVSPFKVQLNNFIIFIWSNNIRRRYDCVNKYLIYLFIHFKDLKKAKYKIFGFMFNVFIVIVLDSV